MGSIRVLLADDHTILRQGIRVLLENHEDIEVVGEASDGREAISLAKQFRPDVVLMDIAMPLLNGLEATRQIKHDFPEISILVLTMYDTEEYVSQILRAGAAGYVLKKVAATELVSAIRAVYQGEAFLYPSVTRTVLEDYLRRVASGQKLDSYETLTNREREIVQLVAEGHTNKEIAKILCISIKTVQTHRTHLMEKLGMHDRSELIKYAVQRGIIQP